jgi:hypothetical protein
MEDQSYVENMNNTRTIHLEKGTFFIAKVPGILKISNLMIHLRANQVYFADGGQSVEADQNLEISPMLPTQDHRQRIFVVNNILPGEAEWDGHQRAETWTLRQLENLSNPALEVILAPCLSQEIFDCIAFSNRSTAIIIQHNPTSEDGHPLYIRSFLPENPAYLAPRKFVDPRILKENCFLMILSLNDLKRAELILKSGDVTSLWKEHKGKMVVSKVGSERPYTEENEIDYLKDTETGTLWKQALYCDKFKWTNLDSVEIN